MPVKVEIFEADGMTRVRLLEPLPPVPAGYVSDGMSIPRLFWRLLSPPVDGRTLGPCIRHDWRYGAGEPSRAEADRLLREELIGNGYPRRKAWCVWLGVRIGGAKHFNREKV